MKKRGFLQISFAWLFAIIVGAFILFLAIYAVTKVKDTGSQISDAKIAKEIGILLNPLETSFESSQGTLFKLPVDSRIYNGCKNSGIFGKQIIRVSQKSFDKWTESDIDISFSNKYILSEKYVEGRLFYLFSKPFKFGFKVADLIYMTSSSEKYCFFDASEEIEGEIKSLSGTVKNLFVENCPDNSINVCFESDINCDILVKEDYVEKNGEKMYYGGNDALMYAGIFSTEDVYECQLNRLMQRVESLSLLYKDKINLVSRVGCNSNLKGDLIRLSNRANEFEGSEEIDSFSEMVENINKKNDLEDCKLW